MTREPSFYTASMAKLYADQGYWQKAAEIYRFLLQRYPHNEELRAALQEIEQQQAQRQAPTCKDLQLLMREWSDLMKRRRRQTVDGKPDRQRRRQ